MPRPLSLTRALLLGVLLSVPADLTLWLICWAVELPWGTLRYVLTVGVGLAAFVLGFEIEVLSHRRATRSFEAGHLERELERLGGRPPSAEEDGPR